MAVILGKFTQSALKNGRSVLKHLETGNIGHAAKLSTGTLENPKVTLRMPLRDAEQQLPFIETDQKRIIIEKSLGVYHYNHKDPLTEITSFVGSKMQQFTDAEKIQEKIGYYTKGKNISTAVLVIDKPGTFTNLHRAIASNVRYINLTTAASENFLQKNAGAKSIEDMNTHVANSIERARNSGVLTAAAYISCSITDPVTGEKIDPKLVAAIAANLYDQDVPKIIISDTTDQGTTPDHIKNVVEACKNAGVPVERLVLHLHNKGEGSMVMQNLLAAYQCGIENFDVTPGGYGGCTTVKAPGNVAAEDAIKMFYDAGVSTNMDLERIVSLTDYMQEITGRKPQSEFYNKLKLMGNKESSSLITDINNFNNPKIVMRSV